MLLFSKHKIKTLGLLIGVFICIIFIPKISQGITISEYGSTTTNDFQFTLEPEEDIKIDVSGYHNIANSTFYLYVFKSDYTSTTTISTTIKQFSGIESMYLGGIFDNTATTTQSYRAQVFGGTSAYPFTSQMLTYLILDNTINSSEIMSTSTDQVFQQFLLYSQYFLDLIIIGILAFLIFKFITYGRN